jgi:hypothetical protein
MAGGPWNPRNRRKLKQAVFEKICAKPAQKG